MSKRAKRIKEKISLERVLSDYGYDVREGYGEQQFSCDLHGDGRDGRPSARVYPETNSWFCFACGKVRDSISTVMEKQGVDFSSACKLLEKKYGLPVWEFKEKEEEVVEEVNTEIRDTVLRRLKRSTEERVLSFNSSLKLWESVNLVLFANKTDEKIWLKIYRKIQDEEDG